jgi:proline iminopeptidase
MKLLSFLFLPVVFSLSACSGNRQSEEITSTYGYVKINGSDVYYKTMGAGSPIVFIHGGPVLDHSYLLPPMAELARDHQLIFYDQRACGKSSLEVDTTTMSIPGFVEDIELLRRELNLGNIHLLGHSWGGLLAMSYAVKYPDHLRSLILSNSIPASTEKWQEEQMLLAQRITPEDSLRRAEILQSGEMQENPSEAVRKLLLLSYKPQFYNPELLDSLSLHIPGDYMERSREFQRLGPDLASFNLYEDLEKFDKPTLIIYGDQEPAAALSAEELERTIPNAEYVRIKDCGHFPFVEQPELYFDAIRTFLHTSEK